MIQKKIWILAVIFFFVWLFHALLHRWIEPVCGIKKVGLCIVATGKYIEYIPRLLHSADSYFLPNHQVTYFVFTDSPFVHTNAHVTYQSQLGWPYDSMMRFEIYHKHKELFEDLDYIYAIDADMLFVDTVGNEILSELVATVLSVHLFDPIKPYEANPLSTAYVHMAEGKHYFAGAFYGGTKDAFLHLIETLTNRIHIDLARGYIAWAHDESHLNRYFIDCKPTCILSPSYCHFDHWRSPYPRKIVAFDNKDYAAVRKPSVLNPLRYFEKIALQALKRDRS
jgi:histo-blood group ABO system transferase